MAELLNLINKQDISHVSRDQLVEVLTYYKRLNVIHIDSDDKVMWL